LPARIKDLCLTRTAIYGDTALSFYRKREDEE